MQDTPVQSLGLEDPLEEEMATHSSVLAGNSHGQRRLVGCNPWGLKELGTTEHASVHNHARTYHNTLLFKTLPHALTVKSKLSCNDEEHDSRIRLHTFVL